MVAFWRPRPLFAQPRGRAPALEPRLRRPRRTAATSGTDDRSAFPITALPFVDAVAVLSAILQQEDTAAFRGFLIGIGGSGFRCLHATVIVGSWIEPIRHLSLSLVMIDNMIWLILILLLLLLLLSVLSNVGT